MERRDIMRIVIAVTAVVAFTAWNIHQVPLTADGAPFGAWVLGFWFLVGAICGRWPAVCLPLLAVVAVMVSGVENSDPIGDMPYAAGALIALVVIDLPMTLLGIGMAKLLTKVRRRRLSAGDSSIEGSST
jgi:hypothetical protein